MRLWYISHRQPAKTQVSLLICAVSQEPSLFAYMKYGSRQRVRPKNQTSSSTGWLRMRVWRMSLRRTKSAMISWAGSFHYQYTWKLSGQAGLELPTLDLLSDLLLTALVGPAERINWAPSPENLSSGFGTRIDSNRFVQSQKLGKGSKFQIKKLEVLYYLGRLISAFVVRI